MQARPFRRVFACKLDNPTFYIIYSHMLQTFKKYAAATALSLPLMIPAAVNGQAMPMAGTAPLGNQPVACEQTPTLGALNDCLSVALPMSDSVQSILTREAGLARQAFDSVTSGLPRATAQRLHAALGQYEQRNIAACQLSQQSAARFNQEWTAALESYPGFGEHDNDEEIPFIDNTPALRAATRGYMINSAECLATGVDTLQFLMNQSGASALEVQRTVAPLYRSIQSYRDFNVF